METLSMSKREIDQISVFEDLKKRKIKQNIASRLLDLSIRQIKRKLNHHRRTRNLSDRQLRHPHRRHDPRHKNRLQKPDKNQKIN